MAPAPAPVPQVQFTAPAAAAPPAPPIQTEPLNGLPSWPIGLLAGVEGAGKTAEAIIASASPMVGRTFMIVVGEDTPHDYASIPGQRVEVVKHDGTYRGLLNAVSAARQQPRLEPNKPNLILLDSGTRLGHQLSDNAQESANQRARKNNKYVGEDGADIGRDLWNTATTRWGYILDELRLHDGPSLITARLDLQSLTDPETGQPTKDKAKEWKVVAQKMLPYEVGFIVQMRGSYPVRDNYLAKVKQWGYEHKVRRGKAVFEALPDDFSVEWLWKKLGLDQLVGQRDHASYVVQSESDQTVRRDEMLAEVMDAAHAAGVPPHIINIDWGQSHNGQHITQTTDLGGLELLRDDLRVRAGNNVLAQQQSQGEPDPAVGLSDEESAALRAQDARAPEPEPTEPERAPDPAPAQEQRAPATETRAQRQMALAMAELAFQADVLAVNLAEYAKPVLATPGDLDSFVPAKTVRFLIAQRQQVIPALRDQGRATEAEAYERLGQAYPIMMEHVTEAEGFTREPVTEAAPAQ